MRIFILGLIAAILITLVIIGLYSPIPFDPYNHGQYGYSKAGRICLKPIPDLSKRINGTLFLIADRKPDERLIMVIRAIAENGGITVILGGRYVNDILRLLNIKSAVTNDRVRDYVFNVANADFPIILVNLTKIGLGKVYHVAFARPSIIDVKDENAIVIGWSSPFSISSGSGRGPYPIIVAFKIGSGFLILLPNPTPFMNSLIDKADNAKFLKALCRGQGLFLESSLRGGPLGDLRLMLLKAYYAISSTWLSKIIAVLPLIIFSCVILLRKSRSQSRGQVFGRHKAH